MKKKKKSYTKPTAKVVKVVSQTFSATLGG
jgi:hypothetical protein